MGPPAALLHRANITGWRSPLLTQEKVCSRGHEGGRITRMSHVDGGYGGPALCPRSAGLPDDADVTGCPGRQAEGTYLFLGPTCRCGRSRSFWALALPVPLAKVGRGGHQLGQGSSGARYTWGALCRTRPPTSSRPEWGRELLGAQDAEESPLLLLAQMTGGRTRRARSRVGVGTLALPSPADGLGCHSPSQDSGQLGAKSHEPSKPSFSTSFSPLF